MSALTGARGDALDGDIGTVHADVHEDDVEALGARLANEVQLRRMREDGLGDEIPTSVQEILTSFGRDPGSLV